MKFKLQYKTKFKKILFSVFHVQLVANKIRKEVKHLNKERNTATHRVLIMRRTRMILSKYDVQVFIHTYFMFTGNFEIGILPIYLARFFLKAISICSFIEKNREKTRKCRQRACEKFEDVETGIDTTVDADGNER